MPPHWIRPYPALPEDTRQSANSLYAKENSYIKIGDMLDTLLAVLIPPGIKSFSMGNRTYETTIHCAMLTIFQFSEVLSNKQMVEAVRTRVDLKYALHLPLNSPALDPHELCEFRQQLFNDPASQQFFKYLLDLLAQFDLLAPALAQPAAVDQILITVCIYNRLGEAVDAIYQGLEALAVTNPEWLRQVTLAKWYERYNPSHRLPLAQFSEEQWKSRSLRMAADIQYLLEEIDKAQDTSLNALQEIQQIRRIWEEQFVSSAEGSGQRIWMLTRCASCAMQSSGEEVLNQNMKTISIRGV